MCAIGPAKGIGRLAVQFFRYGCEVALGKHHVAVEDEQVVALGTLRTVVSALSGSGVRFHEIVQVEPSGILVADLLARSLRAVFYDDDFKILLFLAGEAFQSSLTSSGRL